MMGKMSVLTIRHKFAISVLTWIVSGLYFICPVSAKNNFYDPPHIKRVDTYIERERPQSGVPGTAIALIDGGEIIFSRGYGDANSSGRGVTPDTPFQVASLSKSFTAICVLQLVDEGRLNLDRPVKTYLPEFQTDTQAQSDQITLRHLLTHRSGLSTLEGNLYQGTQYRGDDALDKATARLSKAKLAHAPGEAFAYSNANYAVLGYLLETIEQEPFEAILKRRIFDPLKMKNSYVQIPSGDIETEANGYRHWFGLTIEQPFTAGRMMGPAGGVVSSATDMGRYIAAMSDPETDLLSLEMRTEMFTGQRAWGDTSYGMGWGMRQDDRGEFISHEGLNPGFKSVAGFYSGTKDGVVVLTNRSSSLSDNFALSVLDVAQAREPRRYKPTASAIAQVLFVLILALILAFGFIVSFLRLLNNKPKLPKARSILSSPIFSWVATLGLFATAYGLIIALPALNAMTLSSIYSFYPDLALCLGVGGCAALLWACVLVIRNIGTKKA